MSARLRCSTSFAVPYERARHSNLRFRQVRDCPPERWQTNKKSTVRDHTNRYEHYSKSVLRVEVFRMTSRPFTLPRKTQVEHTRYLKSPSIIRSTLCHY